MINQPNSNRISPLQIYLMLFFLLHLTCTTRFLRFADAGGKRRVHIPDDLGDVVDDEEDEDWKNWGKKKPNPSANLDIPPPDIDEMDFAQLQTQMFKQQTGGPAFGFVKLKLGVPRTPESVAETAMKWTRVLKTGGIDLKFSGIDLYTIIFSMERGQDAEELKDFILEQEDAYEVKIGNQIFRRPGDLPLDDVVEALHRERHNAEEDSGVQDEGHKEEL